MKTIELTVYTVKELKEHSEEGFKRAYEKYCRAEQEDMYYTEEIMDSLKALVKACGFELKDWDLGAYNRGNMIRVSGDENIEGLSGKRALAWLENKVLSPLRIPFTGERRKKVAKYGAYYRPGKVDPCPLTGVCYDEDFINDLKESLKSGMTIKDALQGLESVYAKLVESELEYRTSEECFIESAEANEWEFYADGDMV